MGANFDDVPVRYAPGFIAHLIVSKCRDSFPQYRLEKACRSLGIPMSRSTMCRLTHCGAHELEPIYNAALATVPEAQDVHADETSIRTQVSLVKNRVCHVILEVSCQGMRLGTPCVRS